MGKALDDALKDIEKAYGKGVIRKLGDTTAITTNVISTGSLMLDKILGGGIAGGRTIELFGVESSGKSSLSLQIAAECQKAGGTVAYIDVENSCDIEYARSLGVNVDELIFTQPDSAEEALDIAERLINSGEVKLIIIDSTAALCPQAELDGEMSDMTIGLLARLLSKFFRKVTGAMNQNNCSLIFINQLRDAISTGFSMGPSTTTPGGRALKFFSSQRIELRKTTAIKDGADVIGTNVKIKVVKNKIAPPMKVCELPMIFGKGFSPENEVIQLAIDYELIQKSGGWFTTHDGQRFQGQSKVIDYYNDNPDLAADLKDKVKAKLSGVEIESQYNVDPETGEIIED